MRLMSASSCTAACPSVRTRDVRFCVPQIAAAPNDEREHRIESARHMHQGTALTGPPSRRNAAAPPTGTRKHSNKQPHSLCRARNSSGVKTIKIKENTNSLSRRISVHAADLVQCAHPRSPIWSANVSV